MAFLSEKDNRISNYEQVVLSNVIVIVIIDQVTYYCLVSLDTRLVSIYNCWLFPLRGYLCSINTYRAEACHADTTIKRFIYHNFVLHAININLIGISCILCPTDSHYLPYSFRLASVRVINIHHFIIIHFMLWCLSVGWLVFS